MVTSVGPAKDDPSEGWSMVTVAGILAAKTQIVPTKNQISASKVRIDWGRIKRKEEEVFIEFFRFAPKISRVVTGNSDQHYLDK
jgi:hypothetical protein